MSQSKMCTQEIWNFRVGKDCSRACLASPSHTSSKPTSIFDFPRMGWPATATIGSRGHSSLLWEVFYVIGDMGRCLLKIFHYSYSHLLAAQRAKPSLDKQKLDAIPRKRLNAIFCTVLLYSSFNTCSAFATSPAGDSVVRLKKLLWSFMCLCETGYWL